MGQNQTKIADELAQKYEEIKLSTEESIEKAKKMHSKTYMLITGDSCLFLHELKKLPLAAILNQYGLIYFI